MGIFDSFKKRKPEESSREVRRETPRRREKAAPGRWQVGNRIENRYEIHQILGGPGKSGMGIVYICYDHEFKEPVAIKTFQDRFLQDRASIDRFKWEAETWVRLEKHHNIVQAKYVQEIGGRPYIFLEYVVGDEQYGADLSGWIHREGLYQGRKPNIPLILNLAIQFCHGMIHAQKKFEEIGKPFVHRDVKPQNIMVTRDKVVKVTDFGLVKAFAESDEDISLITMGDKSHRRLSLSKSGNICGTPPYMSPEQCRGEKDIDVRSDIYAFGCVLYEMLARRPPFEASTLDGYIRHHLNTIPEAPQADEKLDKVVLKCLEKDPTKRYQDFGELEVVLAKLYHDLTGERVKVSKRTELEARELSNKGASLATLGFHVEAIGYYQKALRLNPNYAGTHYNLGLAYKDQGKLDEAIREYKEALRLDPNYADAHYNLGLAYSEQGKPDEAIAEYQKALKLDPNYAGTHNNLGLAYKAQGKLDEAIREYQETLRLDPDSALAHNNLGLVYSEQGKPDEAIDEYQEALRLNPNYADAHNNLGLAYSEGGKLDKAIGEYREALRLDPNYADAHDNLGIVYYEQGELDKAIGEYQKALRLDPNHAGAHNNLGIVYKDRGKLDKAIGEYREALRLNPNYADTHYNLGVAYYEQGKLDEAIREYKEALRLDPNHAGAHNNLGIVYKDRGKLDEAVREYKEALRLDPSDSAAHNNLGNAYKDQGKLDEAIGKYREALRLNPNYADAHNNLGFAYSEQEKPDEAITEYQKALRLNPNHAAAHINLGNAYSEQRKLDEAIREYKEALRLNPSDYEVHFNLGLAYSKQGRGRFGEAIECFQVFVRLAPPQYASYVKLAEENIRRLQQMM